MLVVIDCAVVGVIVAGPAWLAVFFVFSLLLAVVTVAVAVCVCVVLDDVCVDSLLLVS